MTARARSGRQLEKLLGRRRHDVPVPDKQDGLGALDHTAIMGRRENDRAAFRGLTQGVDEAGCGCGIEICSRFVQQQQNRIPEQGPRQTDHLALAS